MAVPEKRVALLETRPAVAHRVDRAFADHPEVSAVLVFGSVASGEVDEHSDVDLLVISRSRRLPSGVRRRVLSGLGAGWVFHDRRDDNRRSTGR